MVVSPIVLLLLQLLLPYSYQYLLLKKCGSGGNQGWNTFLDLFIDSYVIGHVNYFPGAEFTQTHRMVKMQINDLMLSILWFFSRKQHEKKHAITSWSFLRSGMKLALIICKQNLRLLSGHKYRINWTWITAPNQNTHTPRPRKAFSFAQSFFQYVLSLGLCGFRPFPGRIAGGR